MNNIVFSIFVVIHSGEGNGGVLWTIISIENSNSTLSVSPGHFWREVEVSHFSRGVEYSLIRVWWNEKSTATKTMTEEFFRRRFLHYWNTTLSQHGFLRQIVILNKYTFETEESFQARAPGSLYDSAK